MLLLAAVVALDGFLGPQVAPLNFAGVTSLDLLAGAGCHRFADGRQSVLHGMSIYASARSRSKVLGPHYRWPRSLRSKWIAACLLVSYLWAYEAFALWNSPRATAWIIFGYFAAAFSVDSFFRGASFCKYVCPIGQFHFVHSLVSPLEVKVREPAVCGSCSTHDCIRGNDRQRGCELQLFQPKKVGNLDCTFCLDCVQACPQENVGILRVLPGETLSEERQGSGIGSSNKRPDITALVLVLVFGAFVNAAGMTEPVMMWMHHWHARLRLSSMTPVVSVFCVGGLLVIPGILATGCGWVSRLWAQTNATWKDLTCSFALTLVPIGFSMWLAHFSNHLVAGWSALSRPERFVSRVSSGLFPSMDSAVVSVYRISVAGSGTASCSLLCVACGVTCLRRGADGGFCGTDALGGAGVRAASSSVWILLQPVPMRGTMMSR